MSWLHFQFRKNVWFNYGKTYRHKIVLNWKKRWLVYTSNTVFVWQVKLLLTTRYCLLDDEETVASSTSSVRLGVGGRVIEIQLGPLLHQDSLQLLKKYITKVAEFIILQNWWTLPSIYITKLQMIFIDNWQKWKSWKYLYFLSLTFLWPCTWHISCNNIAVRILCSINVLCKELTSRCCKWFSLISFSWNETCFSRPKILIMLSWRILLGDAEIIRYHWKSLQVIYRQASLQVRLMQN